MAPLEFRLAVECCRWNFDPDRAESVRSLAGQVDWNSFDDIAERHRISGLAWNALQSLGIAIPDNVRSRLSHRANLVAAHGLQAAAASAGLAEELHTAGIPHLFIKGLVVGALAYPSPFLKQSWDIDVLVGENDILPGAQALARLGYELILPKIPVERLPRWQQAQKDSAWRDASTGIIVELHSRLADNRRLIPAVGINSPRQMVAVAEGIALPTLAKEEMFAHLCVHGASSAWFRLKWIADLAALLFHWRGDTEHLFEQSQQFGAGRSAGQALLLARRLFGIELEPQLHRSLESDPATRWLADVAMDQLLAPEPGNRPLGTAVIHASQLRLLPGLAFKADEARRQLAVVLSNLID